MRKKHAQIKKDNPGVFDKPHIQELVEQSNKLHELKALNDTPGGKELVRLLVQDVVNSLHTLRSTYKEASHMELVSLIANMAAHYETARLLAKSEENEEAADEALDQALSEELLE